MMTNKVLHKNFYMAKNIKLKERDKTQERKIRKLEDDQNRFNN